jgi:hypothetical protein
MPVPEHLLKAFAEAANDAVGDYSEAKAAVAPYITDLESFTEVFVTFEDSGSKELIFFVDDYPELYREYSIAEGLIDEDEE